MTGLVNGGTVSAVFVRSHLYSIGQGVLHRLRPTYLVKTIVFLQCNSMALFKSEAPDSLRGPSAMYGTRLY